MNTTIILNDDIQHFANNFVLYEELREKHFLITGATGLIGSILIKCLLALDKKYGLGLHLTCPVRDTEKAKKVLGSEHINKEKVCILQLTDIAKADKETVNSWYDYIIHLAAPTASKFFVEKPIETFRAVVNGTEAALHLAERTKTKGMVYVSSLEVYGSILDDTKAITEKVQGYIDPMDVRSSYSMGKRAAECLCHCYASEKGLRIMTARLAQTFGAGVAAEDSRVFAQFARSAVNHEDIILHTQGTLSRCYCYTTDAVEALLYILLKGEAGEAYNVANPNTYISVRDMAQFIQHNFAPDISVKIIPKEGCGYSPVTKLRLDSSKAYGLGWKPRTGLKEMFERLILHLSETL